MHFRLLRADAIGCVSFMEVFHLCLENDHPADLVAMLTSQIWHRRNKLRMGEAVADLRLLDSLARNALLEYQQAHPVASSPLSTRPQTKWEPPPMNWLKINFDGAVFQDRNEAGLGVIIRNDHGLVMAALTQIILLPTSVEMVKVLAARRALIYAWELSFDHIILEGDSDIAICAMSSDVFSAASFSHILSDIKALASHFRQVVFRHTRRQGNKVAHNLARAGCNFQPLCTWIEEIPVISTADYLAEIINE